MENNVEEAEMERLFKRAMTERMADCTFYLIPGHIDASVILNESARYEICGRFAEQIGTRCYAIRYGSDIRSTLKLKEEFARKTEEKVNIIYVDLVENEAVMLDECQRRLFWNAIKDIEEDTDTMWILLEILYGTEEDDDDV
ncbi:MAG: hypothetical protein NC299_14705 [Lachnospiraceae bacterium]|nr:hypothetical protein [Ruminococcus sp.]MCM1276587.1 hypothetical protein [Lachnospiraceae bacterium]